MSREDIFKDINQERKHQEERWGNDQDDIQCASDFQQYINNQFTRAFSYTGDMNMTTAAQRKALVNAAAIVVAAIESFDRRGYLPGNSLDVQG